MIRLPFYLIVLFSQLNAILCTDSEVFEARIYHRLLDPYAEPAKFTERGTAYYNGTDAWIKPSSQFKDEITSFATQGKGEQSWLYQVALGSNPEPAAISSAKAVCDLFSLVSRYLYIENFLNLCSAICV